MFRICWKNDKSQRPQRLGIWCLLSGATAADVAISVAWHKDSYLAVRYRPLPDLELSA